MHRFYLIFSLNLHARPVMWQLTYAYVIIAAYPMLRL